MFLLRLLFALAAGGCSAIFGMKAGAVQMEIFAQVNDRLPREQRISLLWARSARRAYAQLFPDGPLLERRRATQAISAVSFVILAIALFVQ